MSQPVSPRAHTGQAVHHATWNPQDIPYSEHFENSLHQILDYPPRNRDGITILADDSPEQPQPGLSVRARDIDPRSLPTVTLQQLPLSLHDPRRIFASPIPGIRLTHPGGYLQGGPGTSESDHRAFAQDFISRANVSDPEQLSSAVKQHISQNLGLAQERLRARHEAQQHNARVEKEIKTLMDQREMEVKIETRMKEDAKRRRENREHKRKVPAV